MGGGQLLRVVLGLLGVLLRLLLGLLAGLLLGLALLLLGLLAVLFRLLPVLLGLLAPLLVGLARVLAGLLLLVGAGTHGRRRLLRGDVLAGRGRLRTLDDRLHAAFGLGRVAARRADGPGAQPEDRDPGRDAREGQRAATAPLAPGCARRGRRMRVPGRGPARGEHGRRGRRPRGRGPGGGAARRGDPSRGARGRETRRAERHGRRRGAAGSREPRAGQRDRRGVGAAAVRRAGERGGPVGHLGRRRPLRGIRVGHAADQRRPAGWHRGGDPRARGLARHGALHGRGARERRGAGQRLQQHEPERVDVGGGRWRLAARLLGRQIRGRAHHESRRRDPVAVEQVRDAEVSQLRVEAAPRHIGRREQHVRRLHVPVHDAGPVHGVQPLGQLGGQLRDLGGGQRSVPQQARQRGTVDELHHEVVPAVADAGVEQRHERRMAQRRQHGNLAAGARGGVALDIGREQLDGDGAAQGHVLGAVHARHAAGADAVEQPVAAVQHRGRRIVGGIGIVGVHRGTSIGASGMPDGPGVTCGRRSRVLAPRPGGRCVSRYASRLGGPMWLTTRRWLLPPGAARATREPGVGWEE